jgi:hypothetical protein
MWDVQVRPDKSENEITMKIDQWAGDTYPVAQKHLDTPRTLDGDRGRTGPRPRVEGQNRVRDQTRCSMIGPCRLAWRELARKRPECPRK